MTSILDDRCHYNLGPVTADIAYLTRSEHRLITLDALSAHPRSRSELCELTGVSSSTIRRTLREFEKRNWIHREGYKYEATQLGAFIASGMEELIDQVQTEREVRDIWHWLPGEDSGFAIQMCCDAVVTIADTDDPYAPVNRFESFLRESSEFRFIGSDIALLKPCTDMLLQRISEGMTAEIIDSPSAARDIFSSVQDSRSLESDDLTVLVHRELPPYGIGIFDDRVAISGYEEESGTVRVLLDADTHEAREWAESTYKTYQKDTRRFKFKQVIG